MIGMSYTYEIDVQAMFDDRTDQFEKFGIPLGDIEKVRAAVTDSGPTRPVVGLRMVEIGRRVCRACLEASMRRSSSAGRSRIRSSRSTSVGCRMGCTTSWEMPCTGITPTLDGLTAGMEKLVRRDLLAQQRNSPMLVINGADDYFVRQGDTLVFEDRPNTEVHLIPGTGHVAMSKAAEVIPMVTGCLRRQLRISAISARFPAL